MADEMHGIKKVAHFFLSAHPKDSFQESQVEGEALIRQTLTGRARIGLVWLKSLKNHLVLTAAFAQGLVRDGVWKNQIRILGFKKSLAGWLDLRFYFPSLPYSPHFEDPSGYTLFPLSPGVELAYIFGEEGLEKMGKPQGTVKHLVSLSGREAFLRPSFFLPKISL